MLIDYPIHATEWKLYKQLDNMAASGDFDKERLDHIRVSVGSARNRVVVYYLASLYLQLGEDLVAWELISELDGASSSMKKFFHVLSFCHRSNLPVPKLTVQEKSCIDYLDRAINPEHASVEQQILEKGSFSIVGNSPGGEWTALPEACKFYFNSYRRNSSIKCNATIHVVTPSWKAHDTDHHSLLCITGNSIFHRKSRVWQKFIAAENYPAIYTVPRSLWRSLRVELGASPSAGLLIVALVAEISARHPQVLTGHVAGFSFANAGVNHDYDSEPASKRHNWSAEAVVLHRLMEELEKHCSHLAVETE